MGTGRRNRHTTANVAANSPVHTGSHSTSAKYTATWGALYFGTNSAVPGSSEHDTLSFWIHGGSNGGGTTPHSVAPVPA
jgi:hypothetical protein